ncbi:MAG: glycosyltransferase family 1 protein [Anaeromyxobacter sp.]
MRIGIDATLVRPDRLTGVERYALSLLGALARLAPPRLELVLFVRSDAPPAVTTLPFERCVAPRGSRVRVDQLWMPAAARRAGVALLHSLAFPTPLLWRGPSVLTVHDATPWLHPGTVSTGMRYYYAPLFPQAMARAAAVLTVSEASRRDLARTVGVAPERIHVTPNGVEPRFFEARRAPSSPRYLLAVGTIEPRKNFPALLQALRHLRAQGRDLRLVLAGRRAWGPPLTIDRDLAPHVELLGPVPDEELPGLYAGASCYVLPSLYEGFGITLAEAMAVGVPAVASDIPALREVGGDTVRYADPRAPASLAAAIGAALDDRTGSAVRALAARERARRFRWEAAAETTLRVYEQALATAPRRQPRRAQVLPLQRREVALAAPLVESRAPAAGEGGG